MTTGKILRAYGDREGDGMVQLSFTLAVEPGDRAREAAKRFAEAHGLKRSARHRDGAGARGATPTSWSTATRTHSVDSRLDPRRGDLGAAPHAPGDRASAASSLGRKIVVVGACTGADAHTVGIDAILNFKGFAGEKGLESYKCFDAHNLGAQVENAELLARAHALAADAILVSQVITQRNCHKENAPRSSSCSWRKGDRERFVLLLGGPRIDHKLAVELGFDAGFGPGTKPASVASFLVDRLVARGSAQATSR